MEIGGGKISFQDIDKLSEHPEATVVIVSGLRQDTFEYFIEKYGKQLKAIRFFKNKFIEDLSPLSSLPNLEYLYFYANQRITSLWDMSCNTSLSALCIDDFSRLHSIEKINTAPNLKEFRIGNAIWEKMCVESFLPLAGTKIEHLTFTGRSIKDNDLSFLEAMPELRSFDFPLNFLTTEQVAWIVSNYPHLKGYSLCAKVDYELHSSDSDMQLIPGTIIVGKRKPSLKVEGNEQRIKKYIDHFEVLKARYKGLKYYEAFPCDP